jgi:hypothetical protein
MTSETTMQTTTPAEDGTADPSTAPAPETTAPEAVSQDVPAVEADALGEGGQRALEREREARREAERSRRESDARAAELADRVRELELASARRELAGELRLSPAQAELLQGADIDEMRAHATRLLEAFAPSTTDTVRRRPMERLRPGGVSEADGRPSMGQLADQVLRG